jgi:hypothetical protein
LRFQPGLGNTRVGTPLGPVLSGLATSAVVGLLPNTDLIQHVTRSNAHVEIIQVSGQTNNLNGSVRISRRNWLLWDWVHSFKLCILGLFGIKEQEDIVLTATVHAIARGDIEDDHQPIAAPIMGEINTPVVQLATRRARRRGRSLRVPTLAGEIAREARQRLGKLPRNSDNENLYYEDIARRVEARKKTKDPAFVNLRSKETLLITQWAVEMVFLPSIGDEDIADFRRANAHHHSC